RKSTNGRDLSWSCCTEAAASDPATAAYKAPPRMIRTTAVEIPLHATRRQRTRRMSRASLARAACSAPSSRGSTRRPAATAEAVPHTADGLDLHPGVAELRAQVVDVGVDRVGRHRDAERPGVVEQLVAGQRLARVAHERLEQRELARAEIDVAAADGDPPRRL